MIKLAYQYYFHSYHQVYNLHQQLHFYVKHRICLYKSALVSVKFLMTKNRSSENVCNIIKILWNYMSMYIYFKHLRFLWYELQFLQVRASSFFQNSSNIIEVDFNIFQYNKFLIKRVAHSHNTTEIHQIHFSFSYVL